MTDSTWRPLGVEEDEQIAEYDALHDGVPMWMVAAFWAWVRASITEVRRYSDGSGRVEHLREAATEQMAQALRIPLPNLRVKGTSLEQGRAQIAAAMKVLQEQPLPLQVVDYVLAHFSRVDPDNLDALLECSNSAWRVGTRAGMLGLVRRVPLGVQTGADLVMA